MKIDRDAPVGVFDSGIGGLTVAREIMRNLPAEKIVYFGDTARVPYGSKSRETIIGYSRQIIRFLKEQKVKAIVVACNTASAFALEAVQEEFDIPILGVIEAGAKVAAQVTRNKRVGIIGTEGTVGSGIHAEVLKKIDPEITVIGKPCPLFVPLVEEGWTHDPDRPWCSLVCKETGVGNNGFVIVRGKQPKAKGRKNDLLILVQEEPDSNEIIYVNQLCVDGIRYKENEWYGIAD